MRTKFWHPSRIGKAGDPAEWRSPVRIYPGVKQMPSRDWFLRALVSPLDSRLYAGALRNARPDANRRSATRREEASYILTRPEFKDTTLTSEDLVKGTSVTGEQVL